MSNKIDAKRPKILMVGRSNYLGVARLPKALHEAGAEVIGLCRSQDFLAATRFLDACYAWPSKDENSSKIYKLLDVCKFIWVVLRHRPDFVIPVDEASVGFVSRTYFMFGTFIQIIAPKAYNGLHRSISTTRTTYKQRMLRDYNQQLAESVRIRCPIATVLLSLDNLNAFAAREGFPIVIKTDHSVAGKGVRICKNESEATQAWNDLVATSADKSLTVQRYIAGIPAMCAVSARDGKVLSHLSALKIQVFPGETGPSSAVKLIDHLEMLDTAKKICAAFHYSGFISFDFMVETESQNAWFIECNQRPVPISHFGDMARTFVETLGGNCQKLPAETHVGSEIALYPQEWMRLNGATPASELQYDIPHDDAPLLKAYKRHLESMVQDR